MFELQRGKLWRRRRCSCSKGVVLSECGRGKPGNVAATGYGDKTAFLHVSCLLSSCCSCCRLNPWAVLVLYLSAVDLQTGRLKVDVGNKLLGQVAGWLTNYLSLLAYRAPIRSHDCSFARSNDGGSERTSTQASESLPEERCLLSLSCLHCTSPALF